MKEAISTEHQEYSDVIAALRNAVTRHNSGKRDFGEASSATGLSSSWLSIFADGGIREAGFFKVRRLQHWLTTRGFLPRNPLECVVHPAEVLPMKGFDVEDKEDRAG